MSEVERFLREHALGSRRHFLRMGTVGAAAVGMADASGRADGSAPELSEALAKLEPYLTLAEKFRDVSRGKPIPHSLLEEKKKEIGLTRETWKLEVVSDPDHPTRMHRAMKREDGTALDFAGLMKLAETHAVRFAKVMTCLNIGCPLGMGIWEGVPLREVVWRTRPTDNLRRVFYYGYHNDDPKQMFRSSLPPE